MSENHQTDGIQNSSSNKIQVALLIGAMLLIAIYSIARYRGLWGETDTASFTQSMRAISLEGTIIPNSSQYANGYGYSVLGLWISQLTGLSLSNVQLYVAILLAPWIVLPAWLFYREITCSSSIATLAVLILLIQPEFLFPLLRGTHEKFTRGLMFICLYLLVRSLRTKASLRRLISYTLAFYLCVFGLISFNVFLATSFIAGLALVLVICWLSSWWIGDASPVDTAHLPRMGYKILSSLLLVFLFMFYIYPPAQNQIRILNSVADRLLTLLLGMEQASTNPYMVINEGWISLPVYFILSLSNWLLLFSSLAIWVSIAWGIIRKRFLGSLSDLLLWAFFGAFALQGLLSIGIDLSGTFATNLQHRVFPSIAMLAAPLIAKWLVEKRKEFTTSRNIIRLSFALGISLLAVLAVLKATSEPLLSNKWNFHLPGEAQAVRWAEYKLSNRSLWTGFDERVNVAVSIRNEMDQSNLILDQYDLELETRDLLVSSITRLRSQRLDADIPIKPDDLITYDNGSAQIYHLRP
jgi:hypothetical protein